MSRSSPKPEAKTATVFDLIVSCAQEIFKNPNAKFPLYDVSGERYAGTASQYRPENYEQAAIIYIVAADLLCLPDWRDYLKNNKTAFISECYRLSTKIGRDPHEIALSLRDHVAFKALFGETKDDQSNKFNAQVSMISAEVARRMARVIIENEPKL